MTGEVVKPIDYAFSFGLVITCLAYAIGDISGGYVPSYESYESYEESIYEDE